MQFLQGETSGGGSKFSAASASRVLLDKDEVKNNWEARFGCGEFQVKKVFTMMANEKKKKQKNESAKALARAPAVTTTTTIPSSVDGSLVSQLTCDVGLEQVEELFEEADLGKFS